MRIAIIENGSITNIAEFETLAAAIAFYPEAVCLNVGGVFCDIGWHYENGQLTAPVIEVSLEDAIAQKQREIQDYTQALLVASIGGTPEEGGASREECDTWFGKKYEARRYFLNNDPAEAPNLVIEATAAGIPLEALALIVRDKAVALTAYTSHLCGNRTRHYMAVAMLTAVVDVQNYDYSTGWMPA